MDERVNRLCVEAPPQGLFNTCGLVSNAAAMAPRQYAMERV